MRRGALIGRRSNHQLTRWRVVIAVIAMLASLAALAVLIPRTQPDSGADPHAAATPTEAATEIVAAAPSTPADDSANPGDSSAATYPAPSTAATAEAAATVSPAATAAPPATTGGHAGTAATPTSPQAAADVRLEIPAIGVDAWVIRMGLDSNGVMEVPRDAQLVAWYDFTSQPGAPGNAVMSAHLDYRGSTAVFWRLGDLSDGDRIVVVIDGERVEYVVSNIYSTRPEDADLRSIIGGRSGPETLTLITCGGVWDAAEGEYEQRVIVRATRIV